jgi:hypothetical protein
VTVSQLQAQNKTADAPVPATSARAYPQHGHAAPSLAPDAPTRSRAILVDPQLSMLFDGVIEDSAAASARLSSRRTAPTVYRTAQPGELTLNPEDRVVLGEPLLPRARLVTAKPAATLANNQPQPQPQPQNQNQTQTQVQFQPQPAPSIAVNTDAQRTQRVWSSSRRAKSAAASLAQDNAAEEAMIAQAARAEADRIAKVLAQREAERLAQADEQAQYEAQLKAQYEAEFQARLARELDQQRKLHAQQMAQLQLAQSQQQRTTAPLAGTSWSTSAPAKAEPSRRVTLAAQPALAPRNVIAQPVTPSLASANRGAFLAQAKNLAMLVGDWQGSVEIFWSPEESSRSIASVSARQSDDGSGVVAAFEGKGRGQNFHGAMRIGYDARQGRFVADTYDSRTQSLASLASGLSNAADLSFTGNSAGSFGGVPMRQSAKFLDNNTCEIAWSTLDSRGNEQPRMTMRLSRVTDGRPVAAGQLLTGTNILAKLDGFKSDAARFPATPRTRTQSTTRTAGEMNSDD